MEIVHMKYMYMHHYEMGTFEAGLVFLYNFLIWGEQKLHLETRLYFPKPKSIVNL